MPQQANAEDIRIKKTLWHIQTAFQDLVVNTSYDQITVSDLCKKACIGRKTFYMHYSSLDDLIEKTLILLTKDYIARIKGLKAPKDIHEITRLFYLYSEEQGIFYEKLVCSDCYQTIGAKLLMRFVKGAWKNSPWLCSFSPQTQDMILCHIYNSGASLYRRWVKDGKRVPLDEMVGLANGLLTSGLDGLNDLKMHHR